MTAAEKKDIFTFVQLASANCLGYADRSLDAAAFDFQDDREEESSPALHTEQQELQTARPSSGINLQTIIEKVSRCQNCRLAGTRMNTVPGEGVAQPLVMVIGEGPGEMEDRSGRPFVGPAGQLLDKMLAAISLSRTANCYIANIVKCRPPKNRDPYPDEEDACIAFLEAQIHVLKPKILLAMGNTAVKKLLNTSVGISQLRGRFYDYRGIPLTASYHPSALLHNESLKRPAWEDLKLLRAWLEERYPGYAAPFMAERQG